ncbi:hypothetical protein HK099_001552 [Clydaea vesicula]|uniref:Uncharacterized protein n=1 Tax=Clydaea vesicula TaxID=447962 RepID=A0AAD5U4Y2_9FUNG|nr:hypothetical protein HK099_001552 [Clydaea vesicula]
MYLKKKIQDLFVVKGYDSYTYELVTSTLFNGAPIWRRSDGYCYLYWFIENASGNRAWVMQCAEKPSGNWQAEGHAIDSWNKPEFFNSYPWDKAFTNHAVVTRNFDLKVTSKPYGLTNVIFTLTTTFNDAPVWSFGRECFIFWFAKLIWVLQCSPMTAIWAARDSAKNSQGLPDYSTILPWSSNAGWDSTSVLKVQKRCY